jgi:hypothetical protein
LKISAKKGSHQQCEETIQISTREEKFANHSSNKVLILTLMRNPTESKHNAIKNGQKTQIDIYLKDDGQR